MIPNTEPRFTPPGLSPSDREHLAACGILDEVMDARGYWTARSAHEVPTVFAKGQRRPGLVIPSLSPLGEVRYQLRVRERRRKRDGTLAGKYEKPYGSENGLDVNPLMLEEVRSGTSLLIHTEGCKGVDACASIGDGVAAIGDGGVHCFGKKGTKGTVPIDDFSAVNMRRPHLIVYDADARTNDNVQEGLKRRVALTKKLAGPGWPVKVAYLPEIPDLEEPGKAGIDDFFAAGYDLSDLLKLAQDYEPVDVGEERVKRDSGLAALVEEMREGWLYHDWPSMIGTKSRRNITSATTARDVCLVGIERSKSTGKVIQHDEHGQLVVFPWSNTKWARAAAVSRPALIKAKKNLLAEGLLVEVEKPVDRKNPHTYALLIGREKPFTTKGEGPDIPKSSEVEGDRSEGGKRFGGPGSQGGKRFGDLPPRLRWSSGGWKPKRGVVPGTSKVRTTPERPPIPPTTRLGKVAGSVLDHLVVLGGGTTHEQLLDATHLTPKQASKPLAMLEEFRVVVRGEFAGEGVVLLADGWREALAQARRLTGEHEATQRERERMRERAQAWAEQQTDWSYVQRQRKRRQREPWKPSTDAERVNALVVSGMGRRFAAEAVYGDDPPHGPRCACPECF